MIQEFIPYEQALVLKELGFDEPCFGLYHNDKTFYLTQCKSHEQYHGQICSAPTFSQCFRFFREKYNFCYFIRGNNYDGYSYNIDNLGLLQYKFEIDYRFTFKTYEEAELACLIKLIEIVKKK